MALVSAVSLCGPTVFFVSDVTCTIFIINMSINYVDLGNLADDRGRPVGNPSNP